MIRSWTVNLLTLSQVLQPLSHPTELTNWLAELTEEWGRYLIPNPYRSSFGGPLNKIAKGWVKREVMGASLNPVNVYG